MQAKQNVFIVGLTDFQRHALHSVANADRYHFHSLLSYHEAVQEHALFSDLLNRARRQLDGFRGTIDAIVCHWDFPTSCLVPVLCAEYGIPGPSLESVLKCEHKYWARLEQAKAVPEHVPRFAAVDPFDPQALRKLALNFPFWLKPVKGFSSMLGFRIDNKAQLKAALAQTRAQIGALGHAFDEVLTRVDLPPEVQGVGGLSCIAEEIMTGVQAAPEGYFYHGDMHIHGLLDMVRDHNGKSFSHLLYPSTLPQSVQQRMHDVSRRALQQVGFDNSCFNVEFMWNAATDKLWLIEVNTRMSQSHSELFLKVDGMSNHAIAIDLALGRRPHFPHRQGRYAAAAKFWISKYGDTQVLHAPTAEEVHALEQHMPGEPRIEITVQDGCQLSQLPNQDAYRYVLGEVYIGGNSGPALLKNYHRCLNRLDFRFSDAQRLSA